MSAPPSTTSSGTPPDAPERNQRLLIVLAVLGVLSVVIAAVVISTAGEGAAPEPDTTATLSAGRTSLRMGSSTAPTRVVVYEDLAGPSSRAFDVASRDFLDIMAAQGQVRVEYQQFTTDPSAYAAAATSAWGTVLDRGTPKQVLRLQELLLDRQPAPGRGEPDTVGTLARRAGVTGSVIKDLATPDPAFLDRTRAAARAAGITEAPAVVVDGRRLQAASPVALADALQRRVVASSKESGS